MDLDVNKKYNKLVIYYFSGTGNAKFAAHKIEGNALSNGVETSVINVASDKNEVIPKNEDTLIGFCYPTHGFNAPPIVLKYFMKFPKGKANVFFLNTRAGMKMYKLHLPGLGGIALWLPAIIMFLKGYKPVGFRPLDLPSNWISLHPGLRNKVIESIRKNCTNTLNKFTNKILSGKLVLNGLIWLPIDLLLIPLSIGYYIFGRFALAKTFFPNFNCNNCGLCIKECPVNAIVEKNNMPYWTFDCESCMKCMNRCPHRAIETAHGFTFVLWWLVFSFIPVTILKLLLKFEFVTEDFYQNYYNLLFNVIMISVGFILLFLGYWIMHQMLRVKLLNKIITYTSLTHYKFWRRYLVKKSKYPKTKS